MTDLELVTKFLDALRAVEDEIPSNDIWSGGYVEDADDGGATVDGWWSVEQLAHALRAAINEEDS